MSYPSVRAVSDDVQLDLSRSLPNCLLARQLPLHELSYRTGARIGECGVAEQGGRRRSGVCSRSECLQFASGISSVLHNLFDSRIQAHNKTQ